MNSLTRIYLIGNCFNDPTQVYIGKTKNSRKQKHMLTYGSDISYDIIDEVNSLSKEHWKPLEEYWIEQFKQWGFNVLNKNKAGGGADFQTISSNIARSKAMVGHKSLSSPQRTAKILNSNKKHYIKGSNRNIQIGKKNKKPVFQYDLKGNFIKKWDSITSANKFIKSPISSGEISLCCSGKIKSYYGFIWRYKKEKITFEPWKGKSVIQYNKQGDFIKEWFNITQAANALTISQGSISSCCNNKLKSAGGYVWKHKNK